MDNGDKLMKINIWMRKTNKVKLNIWLKKANMAKNKTNQIR